MEEDAGLGNGGLGRLAGELLLLPDGQAVMFIELSHLTPPTFPPPCCFLSLFPGLHGLSGSGSLRIRHPI